MSLHSYKEALNLAAEDRPFSTYIFAAMRKADSANTLRLQLAFPALWTEFHYRYWSAGGLMPNERGYNPERDDNLPLQPRIPDQEKT